MKFTIVRAICALVAAMISPLVFAGRYEIMMGEHKPLCRDLLALLSSDAMPPMPKQLCLWRFEPKLPDQRFAKFRLPNWESLNPDEYWAVFKSDHWAYHESITVLPPGEVERRWKNKEAWLHRVFSRGNLVLKRSRFNIDPNMSQDNETVYVYIVDECNTSGFSGASSPHLIVAKDHDPLVADPIYAHPGYISLNPFWYDGALHFASLGWELPAGASTYVGLSPSDEVGKLTISHPFRLDSEDKGFGAVGEDCEFHYYQQVARMQRSGIRGTQVALSHRRPGFCCATSRLLAVPDSAAMHPGFPPAPE